MKGNWLLELGDPTTSSKHNVTLKSAAVANVIRITTDDVVTATTTYTCARTD